MEKYDILIGYHEVVPNQCSDRKNVGTQLFFIVVSTDKVRAYIVSSCTSVRTYIKDKQKM
jgi:hypothetical protein